MDQGPIDWLLAQYANPLPIEEILTSFTVVLMPYNKHLGGGVIYTKDAAIDLCRQINEQAVKPLVVANGKRYTVELAWLEETGESGCVKAKYVQAGG